MGELAGIFRRDGNHVAPDRLDRLIRAIPGQGRAASQHGGGCAIAHRPLHANDASSSAGQPVDAGNGMIVAADARLHDRAALAKALELAAIPSDPRLVAAACERWGSEVAGRLRGSFSFAMWDGNARRLTLARDILGMRGLYYVDLEREVLFASSLHTLLALPETPREIDDLVVAQTMTLDPGDDERTIYRAIRRVPPAGLATFDSNGVRTARYWALNSVAPVRFAKDDDYVQRARELFDDAVASAIPERGILAIKVSGGLDSSGIAATVARLKGSERFFAYHRAPGAAHPYDTPDERRSVEELARRYPNIDLTVIDDLRDNERVIEPEMHAARLCVPSEAGVNASWADSLDDAIRDAGTDVALVGACGNLTLSWAGTPRLRERLAMGDIRGMARALLPNRLLREYRRRRQGGPNPWAWYSLVSKDFLESLAYLERSRATGHDVPFFMVSGDTRALRLRSLQSQVNRDRGSYARHRDKVEARDPFADRRMVEFTLGIPERQFWGDGQNRWLARRVMADRLPAVMVNERRRGVVCPEWYTVVSNRREGMIAALERIERSPLAARVLDVPRIKVLLDDWPKDADAAKPDRILRGVAIDRALSMGGFLRWHEGGNG
jgi:asparagine synthase (glutamine-hydrolysing)